LEEEVRKILDQVKGNSVEDSEGKNLGKPDAS
jgi:hypothetical protein